jgi:rhodanese-related sulfurtransferase
MNDLIQFAQGHMLLTSAWVAVAALLAFTQIRIMASGPKALSSQMLTDMVNRENGVVIDVRPKADFKKGHIHGAINIPLSTLKDKVKDLEKYQNTPIIMVCANGISVAGACSTLKKSGLQQVHKLAGGMSSWVGDNLPVVK